MSGRRHLRIPYVVLALGVVVTAAAATYARSEINAQAAQQARNFTRLAGILDRLTGHLYSRMQRVDEVLRAGAALSAAAHFVRGKSFADWASIHDSTADFRSFGPVRFSSKSEHALSQELLGGGVPGATIQSDMKGAADSTYLVFAPSSPKRRYVALAPVRRGDARSTPVGFVYTRLDVDELMLSELARAPHAGIRVRLYYSIDTTASNLVYDSDRGSTGAPFKSSYVEHHTIYMFGTPWALTVDASSESGMSDTVNPGPTVILAGAVLTLLLFGTTLARARAQTLARDTAARYDALFNSTPMPMWVYHSDTLMICAVNDAAVAQYGYTRREFLALHVKDLRPASEVAAAIAHMKQLAPTYQHAGTWIHRKKDGTAFKAEISAHTVVFEGRQSVVVVANDISERLRAEEAVSESEERLRQMANHIDETFFVVDTVTNQTLYLSPAWSELSGHLATEGTDPSAWFASIHSDDQANVSATLVAVQRGEVVINEFRVVRPDGSIRWARGRSFPVRNASGDVYRMVGVVADITELRDAEERFVQSQKMEAVGRLAGGIAHDFNNLLTVILGEADQLDDHVAAGSSEARSATEIRKAGERAAALTRQLLAFSRRQLVEPVVFDMTATVRDMSGMCGRLIGEDVEMRTRFAPDTWTVRADRGHIEQVLANLVVNARDAMPSGGCLTIETSNVTLDTEYVRSKDDVRAGDYVVLSVSDNGVGMTEDVRARLFEPFFTTKDPGKGTGLGLATCYGIVKQAEGHIAVYSEVGLGTTIRVYLPRSGELATMPIAASAADPLPHGSETILVVEDEPAVRRIAVRLLSTQGYTLLEAENGAEAVAISANHAGTIDLLFTDVVLPGMGGREIAERVQEGRPGIKVLFTSGYTDDAILQHRLLEKDVALLQKPFSRESLTRKVREVLDADLILEAPDTTDSEFPYVGQSQPA